MTVDLSKFRLKSLSFFGMLEPEEAEYARANLSIRELKKGEVLFREGTYPKGVYIVRSGKIKISHANNEGRENILYLYKRAEFFGYRPLLAEEPQPVTATALDKSVVYFLPANVFFEMLNRSDTLSHHLLVNLSREFSVWINKVTVFAQYAVKQRVALSLLLLSYVYGTDGDEQPTISIGRDDLAHYVGTAKETVVRMLRIFKDQKVISARGAKIVILKPDELHEIVSGA